MDGEQHTWQMLMFKGNAVCASHQKKTPLRSRGLKWCWSSGGTLVLVTGSSSGAARKEGQVGLAEFWFSGNSCRALEGGSRKNDQLMRRVPGWTWLWISCTSLLSQSGAAPQISFLLLWHVRVLPHVCWEACASFQGVLETFVADDCVSWAHRSWSVCLSWNQESASCWAHCSKYYYTLIKR